MTKAKPLLWNPKCKAPNPLGAALVREPIAPQNHRGVRDVLPFQPHFGICRIWISEQGFVV